MPSVSYLATDGDDLRAKAARCRRLAADSPDQWIADTLITLAKELEAEAEAIRRTPS